MLFHSTQKDHDDREAAEDLAQLALKRARDRLAGKTDQPADEDDERDLNG